MRVLVKDCVLTKTLVQSVTHKTHDLILITPLPECLRPRSNSPLKGTNPAGTPGYRNGTESFSFGLKGCLSVVRDV